MTGRIAPCLALLVACFAFASAAMAAKQPTPSGVSTAAKQNPAPTAAATVTKQKPARATAVTAAKQKPASVTTATAAKQKPAPAAGTNGAKEEAATASGLPVAGPRTLEDIHIEGEIPVPQVLFITARDQRRLTQFHHRRYLKSGLKVGEQAILPSRIALARTRPTDPGPR